MYRHIIEELQAQTDRYESWLASEQLSAQTRRAYISRIKGFKAFLETCEVPQVDDKAKSLREIAQKYHDHLAMANGAKPSSINASITAVYSYYAFLGFTVPPVLRDWVLKTEPRVLSIEEQERLLQAISVQSSIRDKALLTLLLYTGIRIGECRELTVNNVEISAHQGRIIVSSRGRSRKIPLNEVTRQAILQWLIERTRKFGEADGTPLFPNKTGEFMTRAAIDEVVRKVGRTAHMNICAQVCRNTFLSAMLEKGSAVELVAEIGGQAKLEHVRRFRKEKCASMDGGIFNPTWNTTANFSLVP